jgi:hypothetical protein
LQDQLRRLEDELHDLTMPIALSLGDGAPRTLTPAFATRAFESDLVAVRQHLDAVEDDLVRFQDVRELKDALRHSRSEPTAEELELIEEMLAPAKRRGRGRRK